MDEKRLLWIFLILIVIFHAVFISSIFNDIMPNGGDTPSHYELLEQTVKALNGEGFWDENYFLGFPMFTYYGFFPYVALALLHLITFISLMVLFKASIVLFFVAFPFIIYKSLRLFGFEEEIGLYGGIISLFFTSFIGFGIEYKMIFDNGLWSQLISLLFFPLALSYSFNYLSFDDQPSHQQHQKSLAYAVLFIFLTLMSNLLIGFITLLNIGIIFISMHSWNKTTIKKIFYLGIASFAAVSVFIIPYVMHYEYYGGLSYDLIERQNGFGFEKTMNSLFTGKLLDAREIARDPATSHQFYLPLFTFLTSIGLIIVISKKRSFAPYRWLLYSFLLSLFFMMGKSSFGFLDYIPVINNIQTFRFIVLFHFCSIILSSITLYYGINYPKEKLTHYWRSWMMVVLLLVILSPVVYDTIHSYNKSIKPDITEENSKDYFTLMEQLQRQNSKARVHVIPENFAVFSSAYNAVPVYADHPMTGGRGVGFHTTPSSFFLLFPVTEQYYYLFGVSSIVNRDTQGYHIQQRNASYFTFGNAVDKIQLSRNVNLVWLWSNLSINNNFIVNDKNGLIVEDNNDFISREIKSNGVEILKRNDDKYPFIVLENGDEVNAKQYFDKKEITMVTCGKLINEDVVKGDYIATVSVSEEKCLLVLKASYFPDWKVFVDGNKREVLHVSPNLMGVYLDQGEHDILFEYKMSWIVWMLLVMSIVIIVLLFVFIP